MDVGAVIKRFRKSKEWNQKQLAEKLNVSNRTISSWEKNRTEPNMEMIEKMCELFGCSKSEFFQETKHITTDIEVILKDQNLGKIIIEVPPENEALFTKLNERAMKISPKELKGIIEMMKTFSDDDSEENKD